MYYKSKYNCHKKNVQLKYKENSQYSIRFLMVLPKKIKLIEQLVSILKNLMHFLNDLDPRLCQFLILLNKFKLFMKIVLFHIVRIL